MEKKHYDELSIILPFSTCIRNAIAIDFRLIQIDLDDAIDKVLNIMPKANKIDFNSRSTILQVGFKNSTDRNEALTKDILMDGTILRKTKLHHTTEEPLKIYITDLCTDETYEETKQTVIKAMSNW